MSTETVALPAGTVRLLPTDLVGSALLDQPQGDEAAAALERAIADLTNTQIEKRVAARRTGADSPELAPYIHADADR
jgi:hypothetical protein